jgi:TolB-like protein
MTNDGAHGVTSLDHAEVVRVNLEKVLASSPFATADRLRRFLCYIVEQALAGEADSLKEYSIGVEVYGRKPDFDPRVDAIVRVEASRLRGKLREYYESAGREDPIRIELPKGTYVPLFTPRADPALRGPAKNPASTARLPGNPPPDRRWPGAIWLAILVCAAGALFWGWTMYRGNPRASEGGASVAVLPFVSLTLSAEDQRFADSLTQEITNSLARTPGLRVAPPNAVLRLKERRDTVSTIGNQLGVGAVLEGSVRNVGGRMRITAQLVSTLDGNPLWSETFERALLDDAAVRSEVSGLIVHPVHAKLAGK